MEYITAISDFQKIMEYHKKCILELDYPGKPVANLVCDQAVEPEEEEKNDNE